MKDLFQFNYEVYASADELSEQDLQLVKAAREVTQTAYAPYSNFKVGAAALLQNGKIVTGSNQENASFPVGTCAERVLLGTASVAYPKTGIKTLAVSYHNLNGSSNKPISPCGMCRQALKEFEDYTQSTIRIILAGMEGKVYVLETVSQLLPFSFSNDDMK